MAWVEWFATNNGLILFIIDLKIAEPVFTNFNCIFVSD